MIFRIYTLFPDFFESPLSSGLMGKAVDSGKIDFRIIDIRSYSGDKFSRCDDYPYGGGSGMVLQAEPFVRALEENDSEGAFRICLSPSGKPLNQKMVRDFASKGEISLLCGHYEGIDQRVIHGYVHEEVSIGDFILSGGEYAALVLTDAVARYVPGFMSNEESLLEESFERDLLEYPQYTRPFNFRGMEVPSVLMSGNHGEIERWRMEKRLEKTRVVRPDLYKKYLMRKILGE